MGRHFYVGKGGVARKVEEVYVGVGGVARKATKGYIGINGVARQTHRGTPSGSIWKFRNDIDYDEWDAFLWENCDDQDWVCVAFDINFTVPDGLLYSYYDYEGNQSIPVLQYEFERMELHSNGDEGDSIYYCPTGTDGWCYVGDGGEFWEGRIIVLEEEPSELMLEFLTLFAEEIPEYTTEHYIGSTWKWPSFYSDWDSNPWWRTSAMHDYIREHAPSGSGWVLKYDINFTAANGVDYTQIYINDSGNTEGSWLKYVHGNSSQQVAKWKNDTWYGGDAYKTITLNEAPSPDLLEFLKLFTYYQY